MSQAKQPNDTDDKLNQIVPYVVLVDSNIPEAGKVELTGDYSGTRAYLQGHKTITFKTTISEGYDFIGWYIDNVLISADPEFTEGYSVDKRTAIVAKFRSNFKYDMLEGKDQIFYLKVPMDLSFRSPALLKDFEEIQIDGTKVDPSNYTVSGEDTFVVLSKDFLSTLSEGTHTISIISLTGSATTSFEVSNMDCPFGHTPGAEATCTTNQICTVCNAILTNATGHNYSDVITAPTCTEKGYTTHTCTKCNDVYVDSYTDAKGHIPGTAASCTTDQKCTVCQTVLQAATGHNYNSVVTAPTCTEQGYTTHTCTKCNDSYIDSYTNAKGHTEVKDPAVAPTCTATGLTEGKHCSVCDKVLVAQTIVAATGHNYGTATCTKPATCSTCGTTTGNALGHAWDNDCDTTCNRGCGTTRTTTHVYSYTCDTTCNVCNATRSASHKAAADDGNCTTAIKCSYGCGTIMTSAKSHTYSYGCDTTCNNSGCTAGNRSVSHSANADDGNCTTAIYCKYGCGTIITAAKSHIYSYDCDTTCNNSGCTAGNRNVSHVANADDGNCTTAIYCKYGCGTIMTAAKVHTYSYECDTTCNNSGCTAGNRNVSHNMVQTKAPTCTATGIKTCSYGCDYSESIAKHSCTWSYPCDTICNCCGCTRTAYHNMVQTVAPGCTTNGTKVCSYGCGYSESIAALGHLWSYECDTVCDRDSSHTRSASHDIIQTKDPTCTETGLRECSYGCGYSESIAALGHLWSYECDTTCDRDSSHTRYAEHLYFVEKTPTCQETGIKSCQYCHKEVTMPTVDHNYIFPEAKCSYCGTPAPAGGYDANGKFIAEWWELSMDVTKDYTSSTYNTDTSSPTFWFNEIPEFAEIRYLVLPDSVTKIGAYAFYGYTNLYGVILPSSVTSIGNYAFYNCTGLKSITMPGVKNIGNYAFQRCTGITSISLPDTLTSIGSGAFQGTNITSVSIPNKVTTIGSYAFGSCNNLTSVTIASSVTEIQNNAFANSTKLATCTYTGTVAQWNKITLGTTWRYNTNLTRVVCSDGYVALAQ